MTKKKENKAKKGFVESRYNAPLLRKMCEDGVDAQSAKNQLNLCSLQSLRQHLMRLSVEDNQLRTLPGLYSRSVNTVKLGKQGLKITLKKFETAGINFPEGSEFSISFDGEKKIILEKLGGPEVAVPTEAVVKGEDIQG
ncbi:hypothetical protein [Maridesulfovibrio bastinii]|uniref:hypothetical protein n=1 Tax=Maridesulfovibrio bastinii TaxID=47157 RepID=UPI0004828977|nr:hypothetical protein [Maridesulfovibrio bastinii]